MKKIIFAVLCLSGLFSTLSLQAQVKLALPEKSKTPVKQMNLVDSLRKGRYVVIAPDHLKISNEDPAQRKNEPAREKEPAQIMFMNAIPVQSIGLRKIVLNAGILQQVADANFSARLDFSDGVYRLSNSQPLQYIQLERRNLNQRASLSCQLRKNKRYIITYDVQNQDMISAPRVYQVSYQLNQTNYSIEYTLTDRGQISFVLDTSGTNEEKPNFGVGLGTTRAGSFLLFSCSIEEL